MKITKARLKQIIKEELDVSKQKEQVNEIGGLSGMLGIDPSTLSDTAIILLSFVDMAVNLSPAVLAGAAGAYFGDKSAKNMGGYEITRAHQEKARKLNLDQFERELKKLKNTAPKEAEAIENFQELIAQSPKRPVKEAAGEMPKSTLNTLQAFQTRLSNFLRTQDDVEEVIGLMVGMLQLVQAENPSDFTDSEKDKVLVHLIQRLRDMRAGKADQGQE